MFFFEWGCNREVGFSPPFFDLTERTAGSPVDERNFM
jgi:hypothetical protein